MQLVIENLSKTYKNGIKALDGVNLKLDTGIFGLLGPNGAGKSSLMRTIATLQLADNGSITFNDIDVFQNPTELRKQLGYLPQEFGVYPKVTAYNMLMHIAAVKGISSAKERKETVLYMLNKVNLYKARNISLKQYSGGMRQRFGIAQAMMGNPKLIIVDEPTAGLDPLERNRFHNTLSQISEEAIIILSTHIVDDVVNLCENMCVFNQGKVLVKGHPSELTSELEGKIWRKQIAKDAIKEYAENHSILSEYLRMGKMYINVFADEQPEGFEAIEPTLEELYFKTLKSV